MDVKLAVVSAPTAEKQRLLTSEWLGRKVIDIGTASGLKCSLLAYARPLVRKV